MRMRLLLNCLLAVVFAPGLLSAQTKDALPPTVPVTWPADQPLKNAKVAVYQSQTDQTGVLFTIPVRRALVDFRNANVPEGPAWTERANAALLLGAFDITPDRAQYSVFGSATKKTGAHVARATSLLAQVASLASQHR